MSNVNKKSDSNESGIEVFWGFIKLFYVIFIAPVILINYLVRMVAGHRLETFFKNFVYKNQGNQFKINSINLIISILGHIAAIPVGLIFWGLLFLFVAYFVGPGSVGSKRFWYEFIISLIFGVPCLIFAIIKNDISEIINSPQYQKKLMGLRAERTVMDYVEKFASVENGWKNYHNILLVFDKGLPTEWSREIDHILIKKNSIYIIETKYKSGNIFVDIDSDVWRVDCNGRITEMRNALNQVVKTAKILCREFNIPDSAVVPIVAVVGENLKITNAPTNVVDYLEVVRVIAAFENNPKAASIETASLIKSLENFICTDQESFERHIARAEEAKIKEGFKGIVSGAHRGQPN